MVESEPLKSRKIKNNHQHSSTLPMKTRNINGSRKSPNLLARTLRKRITDKINDSSKPSPLISNNSRSTFMERVGIIDTGYTDPNDISLSAPPLDISVHSYEDVLWTEAIEDSVKVIGEKSKGYKIMHMENSRKANKLYNWLMYTGICLGPLAGLISGIGTTLNPEAPSLFPVISSCVAFLSGVSVAIIKFGKYEEKKFIS